MNREQMIKEMNKLEKWIKVLGRVDKGHLTNRVESMEISVKLFKKQLAGEM
jgi:hypothetical protein